MTSVSAIIVTYNRLDELKQTLELTLAESFKEVFVINNASTDETGIWLDLQSSKFNTLRVKHLENNIGGAGGFYEGMKWAGVSSAADWFCCFDDDASPQKGSIQKFQENDYKGILAVAAAVYTHDGSINDMNRPGYNPFKGGRFISTFLKGREGYHLSAEAFTTQRLHSVDYSSFVGFFVRSTWVKENNLPRKELFLYADDVFYTLGISESNKLVFDPNIKFTHADQTLASQEGKYFPVWKAYFKYRNDIILYKHITGVFFLPILIIKTIQWIVAVRTYKNNKKTYLNLVFLSIKDGLKNNFSRTINDIKKL